MLHLQPHRRFPSGEIAVKCLPIMNKKKQIILSLISGDSGGPLIILDGGRYYLVGITSAGFGCGVDHQPGIYHNVKYTAGWIRSIIQRNYNIDPLTLN